MRRLRRRAASRAVPGGDHLQGIRLLPERLACQARGGRREHHADVDDAGIDDAILNLGLVGLRVEGYRYVEERGRLNDGS